MNSSYNITQTLSVTIPNPNPYLPPISLTLRVVLISGNMGLGSGLELGRLLQFQIVLCLLTLFDEGLERPLGTAVQPCGINYVAEGHRDTHELGLVVGLLGDGAWGVDGGFLNLRDFGMMSGHLIIRAQI